VKPARYSAAAMLTFGDAQAQEIYMRDLDQELVDLQLECRSAALDGLVTTLNERSDSRRQSDPDWKMPDREFEDRKELLSLTIYYSGVHKMLSNARREVRAGKVPTVTMEYLRNAVRIVNRLRLPYSERELSHHLEAQRAQAAQVAKHFKRTAKMKRRMQSWVDENLSYARATMQAAKEFGISESRVRKLVPKRTLKIKLCAKASRTK
jgi:hypothetical protein